MRNLEKSSELKSIAENENLDLHILHLDINNDESVKKALDFIYAQTSRLDALINNAGYGLRGAFEDLDMSEIKSLYETNVFWIYEDYSICSSYNEKTTIWFNY